MSTLPQVNALIDHLVRWASAKSDILAVALVGSYARNVARETSDVDLVIITDEPQRYLAQTEWVGTFGVVARKQMEDYGMLTSLRVWYKGGLEVEYGLTTRAWAQVPLDKGTEKVIKDGMKVLFERIALLSPLEVRRT